MPNSVAISVPVASLCSGMSATRNSRRRLSDHVSDLAPVPAIVVAMWDTGMGMNQLADAVGEAVETLRGWFETPSGMPLESLVAIGRALGSLPSALLD
jgi:hypothetical protein